MTALTMPKSQHNNYLRFFVWVQHLVTDSDISRVLKRGSEMRRKFVLNYSIDYFG